MSFDKAFQKLQQAGEKVTSHRGDIPKRILEKTVHPAYVAVCTVYATTTLDQRVTTYLFFEARDNLLDALVEFAGAQAQQALALLKIGKQAEALALLEQAVAADLIADGRSDPEPIETTQAKLLEAIDALGFDLDGYARTLDIAPAAFAKRAAQQQKAGETTAAITALGVALQTDPRLQKNPKAMTMAERLTHQDAAKIIPILSDRFERALYLADQRRVQYKKEARAQRKKADSPLQFWLVTIGGGLLLAVLPPISFPTVFGLEADPSGVPPGLIVGVVTSVMFVAGQLKRRQGGSNPSRR